MGRSHEIQVFSAIFFFFQAEGVTDMAAMAGTVPAMEQREELYDPLAMPDVDK